MHASSVDNCVQDADHEVSSMVLLINDDLGKSTLREITRTVALDALVASQQEVVVSRAHTPTAQVELALVDRSSVAAVAPNLKVDVPNLASRIVEFCKAVASLITEASNAILFASGAKTKRVADNVADDVFCGKVIELEDHFTRALPATIVTS